MTRHRRGDPDGEEGDAPWRASDYENAPRQPSAAREYYPASADDQARDARRPARGALGTWSEDTGPGESTGPPWEMLGWDDSQPIRRTPRPGGLTGGHPSGPLPRVSSSGPMPRVSPDSWPGGAGDPLAPLPSDERNWPDPAGSHYPGGDHSGRGFGSEPALDSGYSPDPYHDPDHPSYPGFDREAYPDHQDGAPYLRTGLPEAGFGGGRDADLDYAETNPGHRRSGFGDPAAGPGGYEHDHYAGEPGNPGGGYPGGDYVGEPGYPAEPGYRSEEGYLPQQRHQSGGGFGDDDGLPPHPSYPGGHEPGYSGDREPGYPGGHEPGYPGHEPGYPSHESGYPGHEPGYPDDHGADYPGDHGAGYPDDHEDDHGYAGPGDWYEDDDEQEWADDEDDSEEEYTDGFLPGLAAGTGTQRGRPAAPVADRAYRAGGGGRSRGGGGGGAGGGKGKPRKSAMRRAAPWIALSVVIGALAVLSGVGYYFYRNYLHPPDYSGPGTGSVVVQIKSGESATEVGQELVNLGVVASVRAFSNAAKASGRGSALEVGYFRLHKHMSATLAFAALLKSSSRVQVNLLIPPGLRLYEIIALLGKDTGNLSGYQQAIKDTSALGLPSYAKGNPEGYLFPNTYTVQPGTPPVQVLRQIIQGFDKEAASVNLPKVAVHDQISESDAINVASLVQAEGKSPSDMAKVARVIYNRLNARMRLQLDSTVLYALHSRAHSDTVAQTRHTKSPYNTYLHTGLPPGPIDSPSGDAIQAALHPAHGDWLYFVTVNPHTGLTKFTASYAQFQAYEAELNAYLAKHH